MNKIVPYYIYELCYEMHNLIVRQVLDVIDPDCATICVLDIVHIVYQLSQYVYEYTTICVVCNNIYV